MGEKVHFQSEQSFCKKVDILFSEQKTKLQSLLPSADIHHIGSTAVPGSLTKGDLDIQVRVESEDFGIAKDLLLKFYEVNEGSVVTESFMSFKNDLSDPPLGIQLTVKDSELDIFWKITEVLKENEAFRNEYDKLKMKYQGLDMDRYREAKGSFIAQLMESEAYKAK